MPPENRSRVLIVDDDPVCRRFVCESLGAAGYLVESVATLDAGRNALRAAPCACVICDLELPDGSGTGILADAALACVPALAISAELPPSRREALVRAGFVAALEKPLRAAALVAAVASVAAGGSQAPPLEPTLPMCDPPLLDDDAALAVGGAPAVVDGLRALLLDELVPSATSIEQALDRGDHEAARSVLHRLRAACGFCGAHRLRSAAEELALGLALPDGREGATSRNHFMAVLEETRAALAAAAATRLPRAATRQSA